MKHNLSKSRILSGLQCRKRLYLQIHHPDYAITNINTKARLHAGDVVGNIARQLIPGGIFLDDSYTLRGALEETTRLLTQQNNAVIFEATFSASGLLVRGDILYQKGSEYRLYEVKSSTGVKAYHLNDCAIQSWVMEQAGYPLTEIYLRHINNQFVYSTPGNYEGLFKDEPISQAIEGLKAQVPEWQAMCQSTLSGSLPDIEPGDHCNKPFPCPFKSHCCTEEQADYPVSSLPRAGKLSSQLAEEGILTIGDIPENRLKSSKHKRVREAVLSGKAYIGPEASIFINSLPYPRYYMDFETISFAAPVWIGTRPYRQLPFQWSCHIEQADGNLEHHEFLDVTGNAPMKGFIETLIKTTGDAGPVLVYNASFERMILKDIAAFFPEYAEPIERIIERLVDLLTITRNYYYHPDMHGSWSIKAVLPTIAPELNYSKLEGVQHGGEAQSAYLECITSELDKEKREQIIWNMKRYCELDTYAMVAIARFFGGYNSVRNNSNIINNSKEIS